MRKSISEKNWSREWEGKDVNGMWEILKKTNPRSDGNAHTAQNQEANDAAPLDG